MHEIMQRLFSEAKMGMEYLYTFVPERPFPFITPASLEEQTTNRWRAVWETRPDAKTLNRVCGAAPCRHIRTAMQSGGVAHGHKEL
jgi:hypothetical protein